MTIKKFKNYHKENKHLYSQFKKFTFQAINSKYKNYGSQTIIEKMRWETGIVSNDLDFKINNDVAPFYVRMFNVEHPNYENIFRKRTSIADELTISEIENLLQ